jgi:NADH-quinone oxidoreductase subunit L
MQSIVSFIPFIPFIGFAINGLLGRNMPKSIVGLVGAGSILIAFILSVLCFNEIAATGQAIEATTWTWLQVGNFTVDFGFLVDQLSVWMMLIITGIGFLIHVYSIGYMHDDEGFYKFFAYLNLFVFSMLLLVMGKNFLILFFGWEGVGLCSYLLIGFWYKNADYGYAARKAFVMNRIGDLGLLLGIFLIYKTFGSVNYQEVFASIGTREGGVPTELATTICLLLFVGAIGKSAQIPLFTWLPDAMAGPTPVSALIHAATMVTAGVYLIARCNPLYNLAPAALHLIAIIGLATSIFAALIALRQNDIKKVLAYSTVSQLGLMFLALGMGAYTTAMFHVTTHAFFKALLFLGAGSVIHGMGGDQDMRNMGGLRSKMPVTFWTFLIGTLAIIGFPLLSGFFSKDEILAKTFEHSGVIWWAFATFSALLTGIYMCRLLWVTFYGEFRGTHDQAHHLHESPASMTVPLLVLAVLSVVGGLLNTPHVLPMLGEQWMAHWFSPVIASTHGEAAHLDASTEFMLMGIASVIALLALAATYIAYKKPENLPVPDEAQTGFTKLSANKFYIDEIYYAVIQSPIEKLSKALHYFVDIKGIDGIVNSVGVGVQAVGGVFRRLQNGNIEYYLLGMVVGIVGVVLAMLGLN